MNPSAVAGFLAAVLPLVATPGASLTLLVQRVATGGRREGLPVVLGTVTGLYVHATLAALGLSAVVMRSSQAFAVVRLLGAGYLLLLALSIWRSAAPRPAARPVRARWIRARLSRALPIRRRVPHARGSTYTRALLGNVLNPKAASIYLTLTPQFIDPHHSLPRQVLILATAHAALLALWLLSWTLVLGRAARAAAAPRVKALLSRVSAAVLVVLALRAAAS
ncbi:LysE family translocator [Kitasatospora sp. NBC_01287]|uniref:LysE family translocator n=1 Tax=Kitasatospora sp. NBC_01287 TaxID=2903573 RepID=UPI0022586256|nr:LysE family translocator [Kitasatospora sp. NBC_01287]MCX4744099.1 LysE family translocator [Kitasatospora sp. NBC_01287]